MTIAQLLIDSTNLQTDCERCAVDVDENWDYQQTMYTFSDDSVIVMRGSHADAYDNQSRAARAN